MKQTSKNNLTIITCYKLQGETSETNIMVDNDVIVRTYRSTVLISIQGGNMCFLKAVALQYQNTPIQVKVAPCHASRRHASATAQQKNNIQVIKNK